MKLYKSATFKSNLRNKTSSLLGHVPSFLITLPPLTGLTILTVSRKTIINKHCVCTGHKKEKWILCSSMFYFTTWMMKDTAQDRTRSKRYAHSLKHERVPTTTHILLCVIPLLKWCLKREKSPETWGFAISTPSLVVGVNKPLQDTNKSCCKVAHS